MKKKNVELLRTLAVLATRPEFKALEQLVKVEEKNIIIGSFKVNSSDLDLKTKKAHYEGRIYELRKIMKTFKEAKDLSEEE